MNRNPLIPFVLIMVLGVAGMFLMSFKGLGDAKQIAADKEKGDAPTEEAVAATPEELYEQKGCIGCHGGDYSGGAGPSLKGLSSSTDEIAEILKNGTDGGMPGGLVPGQEAEMAEWIKGLK